ncbi:MAG: NADP oxidoreductase, partial [Myxococcales bacterium]|nr:NADP oxidoreductase [Myxococcales bacterium]
TDSLGEQVQKAFPEARVVKTLNIVSAPVMIAPSAVPGGQPTMFVSGNDAEAKRQVTQLLREQLGWEDVIDLGDITTSRGTEMLLPLWVRTFGALGTPMFGFRAVR